MEFRAIVNWRDKNNRRRDKQVVVEADTTTEAEEKLELAYPDKFVSDIERIDNA